MITWIAKVTCDKYNCKEEGEAVLTLRSESVIDITMPSCWLMVKEPSGWLLAQVPHYTLCPKHHNRSY